MSIDFSKAPKGATHYAESVGGSCILWCRYVAGKCFYEDPSDGLWKRIDALQGVQAIPTFEPFVSVEDTTSGIFPGRGEPNKFTTGSKHDSGKPLMGAVPPNVLLAVARVLTFGAEKYGRDNWRQVENAETRYLDAALRHINAYQRGEAADPESGESHLAHAVCSLMFMLEMQEGA